jgi:hypothetical protein
MHLFAVVAVKKQNHLDSFNLMKSTFCVHILVILISIFASSSRAAEWVSEAHKCAATPPSHSDWNQLTPPHPSVKIAAQTHDKSASVLLMITPLPDSAQKLDAKWIKGFESSAFPPGKAKKTSGVQLEVQGMPAYKATGEIYSNGRTFQVARILWIIDGTFYQISAQKLGAPPLEDSVIKDFVESFRFLKTGAPPLATTPKKSPSFPSQSVPPSATQAVSQTIGTLTFFAIVAVVVIWGAIRLFKKRN